jgi:hypothetical protein
MTYVFVVDYCQHYEYIGLVSIHTTEEGALKAAIEHGKEKKLFYERETPITTWAEVKYSLKGGCDLSIVMKEVQTP